MLGGCQGPGNSPSSSQEDLNKRAEINTQLALQYLTEGEYETALNRVERALAANPRYVDALNVMGLLRSTLGQPDEAESAFKKALRQDPQNSSALNNYGRFLCQQKRYDDGEAMFLRAVGNPLYRQPEIALANAGTCALSDGRQTDAENHFRAALEKQPKLALALYHMADLNVRQQRYLPARGYFQRFSEVAEHNAASLWLGIRIERELGDKDAVASYALQLEKNFPDSQQTKLWLDSSAE